MTSRFKVLLYEAMHAEGTKLLAEKCDVIYAKSFEESQLISLVGEVDAIVIRVGTPHMSANTDEGMGRMSLVAQDILAVLEGEKPEFPAPGSC